MTDKPMSEAFGTPSNWCDRRCERCPLTRDCPLFRADAQKRWTHEARGEDPDDMAVVLADAQQDMAKMFEMVQAIAEEEGIDLDAPIPPMPIVLDDERLQRAGMRLVTALHHGFAPDAEPTDDTREAMSLAMLVAAKASRVGIYLGRDKDETWSADSAPYLLLFDRLHSEFRAQLAKVEGAVGVAAIVEVRRALGDMSRVLDPLIAAVPADARRVLEGLIARGAAPSPFCVITSETPSR